jgi:hypothetical protein
MIPIDKTKITEDTNDKRAKGNGGDDFIIAHTTDVADRWQILFILVIIIGCFLEKR